MFSEDPAYSDRLEKAFEKLEHVSFNENLKEAHRRLLQLGLVPLANDSGDSSSAQTRWARWIAHNLTQGHISFQTDSGEVNIPRSDFVFWVAAVHFQATIFVFSSRKHPQVYSPLGPLGPTDSRIGLFWALDSYSGTSNILPLVCTKTLPRPQPPPVAVDTPEAEHPLAIFREEPREKTRTRHDMTYNLDPFKAAWYA